MSKTQKIIIITVVTLAIAGLLFSLFFYKDSEGRTGFDKLPFGKGGEEASDVAPEIEGGDGEGILMGEQDGEDKKRKFFQLHAEAIAGAYLFEEQNRDEENEDVFARYMERGVGHIFETDMSTLTEKRISNTTRLKIYEAIWGNAGENVLIRYLDDEDRETIRSFLIKLKPKDIAKEKSFLEKEVKEEQEVEDPEEVEGMFLPENIQSISVLGDNDGKIFYLVNRDLESIGTIYNMSAGESSQFFQSEFTEWLTQWPNEKIITLTTKASGSVSGFLYFIDTKTGNMTKILGGIDGLTTLVNPDGKKIIYSESKRNGIMLNLYDIDSRSSQKLPLTTLPEKCIWGKKDTVVIYCAIPTTIQSNLYPDEWYQGVISFSDEIWKIDTETFTTKLLISPLKVAREEMDIINLLIDPQENFLIFTNKKDMSLWGLRL